MNEDTIVMSAIFGAIAVLIVVVVIGALFSDKYDKGKMDEYETQQKYYSWLRCKGLEDLIILKCVPMVELLSSSGNTHTVTRKHYDKHEDFVELEDGVILDKCHAEQKKYYFLGEGVINENDKFNEKKELVLFKADGIEFKSKSDIEWMTTYGLYNESEFDHLYPFRKGSQVLSYYVKKDRWTEEFANYYANYFSIMNKLDKEELAYEKYGDV